MVVNDLRSALEVLKQMDVQLVETDIEVDPEAELAGVYRHVGAGGTVCVPAGNVLRNLWTARKKNLENFCAGRL